MKLIYMMMVLMMLSYAAEHSENENMDRRTAIRQEAQETLELEDQEEVNPNPNPEQGLATPASNDPQPVEPMDCRNRCNIFMAGVYIISAIVFIIWAIVLSLINPKKDHNSKNINKRK